MEPIKIPALRGQIGDSIYYIANLSFQQISQMVKRVDDELHTAQSLKEAIQRSLSNNYLQIKDYILSRKDHFFDSLVLAVYDGDPLWREVRYEIEDELYYNVGLLEFNGEEKIFPVDGQHRVEGIKAALIQNPQIAEETISVVLISHHNTPLGRERSRRIFSTLNRYVKPVRLGDIIALDEDDIVAITTRDLLESYPLFTGNKVRASNNKSIPRSDLSAFTSLMTLYSCHVVLFSAYLCRKDGKSYNMSTIQKYLRNRPTDSTIEEFKSFLILFWTNMRETFSELESFINNHSADAARTYRDVENGGNMFFRPVGLLPFVEATARIYSRSQLSMQEVLLLFSQMNRNVASAPWNKILWDTVSRKMIMRNQSVVKYILIYHYNSALLTEAEKKSLYSKYAIIMGYETIEETINAINNITI